MSEQVGSIAAALAKAQLVMKNVIRNKQAYGYKYAELDACLEALKPLAENGIGISQPIDSDGDKHFLETIFLHESGQWIKSRLCIESVVMKQCNALQQLGAGITYTRKYALCSLAGLAQEDDDAASIPIKDEPVKAKTGTNITASELTKKVDELVALCKANNLDVKEFAKFNGVDSKDIDTVNNAITYFVELKKRFTEHKANIAEHVLNA